MGLETFLIKVIDDPMLITEIMNIVAEAQREVVSVCAQYNLSFLCIGDDLASTSDLLVSPRFLRQEWIPLIQRMLEPVRKLAIPIVFHSCGRLDGIIPMVLDLGFVGLNPIQPNCNDIYNIKKQYGHRICLIGNIDIAGVLSRGKPSDVNADVRRHIEELSSGGGYIVSYSHSITDAVPTCNWVEMANAVHERDLCCSFQNILSVSIKLKL